MRRRVRACQGFLFFFPLVTWWSELTGGMSGSGSDSGGQHPPENNLTSSRGRKESGGTQSLTIWPRLSHCWQVGECHWDSWGPRPYVVINRQEVDHIFSVIFILFLGKIDMVMRDKQLMVGNWMCFFKVEAKYSPGRWSSAAWISRNHSPYGCQVVQSAVKQS